MLSNKTSNHKIEANVVNKGSDVQFLLFLHTLLELHGELEGSDIMYRLRNIIMNTPTKQRNKLNYKNASLEQVMDLVEQKMKLKSKEENDNV